MSDSGGNNDLRTKLQHLLNETSRENASNTPDFILAEYLLHCLISFEKANKAREEWYGVTLTPGHNYTDHSVKTEDLWESPNDPT